MTSIYESDVVMSMPNSSPRQTTPSRRIYLNNLPPEESLFIAALNTNIITALTNCNFPSDTLYSIIIRKNNHGYIQIALTDEDAHTIAMQLNCLPIILPSTFLLANVPSYNKRPLLPERPLKSPEDKNKEALIRETRKQQKQKKQEKRFDMLSAFFLSIPPPGGNTVLSRYKPYSSREARDISSTRDYLIGKGSIDWTRFPRSIDPGYNYVLNTALGENAEIESRHEQQTLSEQIPTQIMPVSVSGPVLTAVPESSVCVALQPTVPTVVLIPDTTISTPVPEAESGGTDVIGRSSALITAPGQYQGLTTRAVRKRAQTESFVLVLRSLLAILETSCAKKATISDRKPWHIVDFGSGSGNLCLALAYLFPNCTFTAVDMKAKSIEILQKRAIEADLTNVCGVVGKIEDFKESFDISLALHACGVATDYALQQAKRCRAAYVVCPCCVGNLKYTEYISARDDSSPEGEVDITGVESICAHLQQTQISLASCDIMQPTRCGNKASMSSVIRDSASANASASTSTCSGGEDGQSKAVNITSLSHPRSKWLQKLLTDTKEGPAASVYAALARAGDIAHGLAHSSTQGNSHTHEATARLCKSHLELDRNMHMEEAGYDTALMQILLSELTGKGDLLVGIPKEWIVRDPEGESECVSVDPPPVPVDSMKREHAPSRENRMSCLLPWSL